MLTVNEGLFCFPGYQIGMDKMKNSGTHTNLIALAMVLSGSMMFGSSVIFADEDDIDSLVLEEVIVTAQKREASMQDVPVSMSAFSGVDLENMGVGRLEDFIGMTPNVSINFNDSIRATEITIRGIVSDPNNVGIDQAAGVYVDGVYMARPTTINTGVYDTERVEILRGPQGTIFGKNTISGALSFITRLPSQTPEFEVVGNFSNFSGKRIYAMGNLPITDDTLALRASVQYEKRDGYLKNLVGPDNNDADNVNGRVSLLYTPNENLEFIFRADAAKDRTNQGATEVLVPSPMFEGWPFFTSQDDDPYDRVIKDSESSYQDRDLWGTSLEVNWDLGASTLTSITAYRTFDWNNFQTTDHSEFDIFGTGIAEAESQLSQELRLASNDDDRLNYVVGLYWFKQDMDAEATAWVGVDAFSVFGAPLGSNPVPGTGYIDITTGNESLAGFGQLIYTLTEKFTITAGLRYTTEDKDITHALFGSPEGVFVPTVPEVSFDRTDSEWTPMLSLQYFVNDATMTYFTFSNGFKAGGYNAFSFNLVQPDGTPAEFDPEYVDNYEFGIKSTMAGGRVRLNAAVFFMDYTDLQVNQLIQNDQGIIDFRTSNAAAAESKGIEIELAAILAEGLDLTMAYGYTDAEYTDFAGATPDGQDFTGNDLELAPKNSFSTSLQYRTAVSDNWNIFARGEYIYRSAQYSDAGNTEEIKGDSYGLLNGRLGFSTQDDSIGVNFWARNLLDEDYAIVRGFGSGAFAPGAIFQRLGTERTYGVELAYRWGK